MASTEREEAFRFGDELGPLKLVHIWRPAVGLKAVVAVDNIARTLEANFGSFDSLKVFARWGFRANFSGTAGQQRVLRSYLEKVSVPLPPLDEQRRIVGLLDRAAEIRRRAEAARAKARAKARAIIPALFLDTFGDPASKPKGVGETHLSRISPAGLLCGR
jgi:hypothetical protein